LLKFTCLEQLVPEQRSFTEVSSKAMVPVSGRFSLAHTASVMEDEDPTAVQERKLPDTFHDLSPREQFFERRALFDGLLEFRVF